MKPKFLLGFAAALVAGASCTEILDIDIVFVDHAGGGGAGAGGGDSISTISSGIGGQGGMGGDGGAGGSVDACTVGLANASDSFLVGGGVGWCELEVAPDSVVFENNGVTLRAFESAWYDESLGPFVYRNIAQTEGDFVVLAQLDVTDGVGADPTIDRHGGGLLVRRPNATPGVDENWVKLTIGDNNGLGVKWYTTSEGPTTSPSEYQYGTFSIVAICKDGPLFSFFAYDGASSAWLPVFDGGTESTQHMELSASEILQVGVVAHVDIVVPGEIVTKARYIHFHPVVGSCTDALPDIPPME